MQRCIVIVLPYKIGFELLAVIDQQILSGHAGVHIGQEIAELCDLLRLRPLMKKCLIKALLHKDRIINDAKREIVDG